jgi:crotonobetainyl-CoA:carnitine CoA-transferase CaiB-like acyl-CoA transferase
MTHDGTPAPDATPAAMQPLAGIRVLDLSQNLAGPWAAQTLADLGADVIKVEPPGGDPARAWGPPFHDGQSTIFRAANRNKRSVVLNLKSSAGRAALDALLRDGCDVFIQSFRRGVIERLGYGPDALRERDRALIYCSVTAYGSEGPLRDLPGYDPLMQAHGGLIATTGHPGAPARVGTSIIDIGTGLWAGIAILAALRERDRTGVGTHVVTSLFDTALSWNAYHLMGWFADGVEPQPLGTAFALIAPYGAFPTRDGSVMIAAGNDGLFRRLCAALDIGDLAADPRFDSNAARVGHREKIDRRVGAATARHSAAALLALLREAGVPCAPVLGIAAVAADEQTRASGMLVGTPGEADRAAGERCPTVPAPLRFNGRRLPVRTPPPPLPDAGEEPAWLPRDHDARS